MERMVIILKPLNNNNVGLALGGFMAVFHAAWSLSVLFGWAQSILDFVFRIHFMNNPITMGTFSFATALILIIFTAIIGYIFGWIFAWLWNMLHGQ